jgi:hypothetical protein
MIKTPSFVFVILALSGGSAFAANLMLDFGATAVADPYLTLSPGHRSGAISSGETSWNTISSATPPASLLYADGTAATGVVLGLGQESTGSNNIISFSTSITNTALAGSGGGTANQTKLLIANSIYGNDTSSTAAGRDGFFGGGGSTSDGAAIGMSLSGLAAGDYQVLVMSRNTNSNATSNPTKIYTSVGAASGSFDFGALSATTQSNVGYSTAVYTNQYENFVNGENYVAVSFTITEGQTLFLAVDGANDATERRGFLNMVQIVQVPEPTACVLFSGAWLLFGFRRRR